MRQGQKKVGTRGYEGVEWGKMDFFVVLKKKKTYAAGTRLSTSSSFLVSSESTSNLGTRST